MENNFTQVIKNILIANFPEQGDDIYQKSYLIQYLTKKTKSANSGSKSRGSFANIYAVYVFVQDYINNSFESEDHNYEEYEGATYINLLSRMR